MGGRGAVRAQGSARIFQALSRGTEMRRAARAFYAASQTVGRYRLARRMGPVTVGLRRLVAPAVSRAQLPHIDLILLSHAHFDHFDLATLRSLERAGTAVVTAKHTSDLLRVRRYQSVQEVGWDERLRVGPLAIQGIRVKHWGARMRSDVHRGY